MDIKALKERRGERGPGGGSVIVSQGISSNVTENSVGKKGFFVRNLKRPYGVEQGEDSLDVKRSDCVVVSVRSGVAVGVVPSGIGCSSVGSSRGRRVSTSCVTMTLSISCVPGNVAR